MKGDKKIPTRIFTPRLNQLELTFFMISRFRILGLRPTLPLGSLQRFLGHAAVPEMIHHISPCRFDLLADSFSSPQTSPCRQRECPSGGSSSQSSCPLPVFPASACGRPNSVRLHVSDWNRWRQHRETGRSGQAPRRCHPEGPHIEPAGNTSPVLACTPMRQHSRATFPNQRTPAVRKRSRRHSD